MVASDGCATQGILNGYASSFHSVDTSSTSRVRRLGRIAMSSRWYPRWAVLPRPISTTSRMSDYLLQKGLTGVVVGSLDGHLDVVRVTLLEARSGNPDELTLVLQVRDRLGADVTHGRAQAADQLVGDAGERATVGHLALDALRHQLVLGDVLLEVAVLGVGLRLAAGLHGAQRTHTAVRLVLLAVDEDQIAGALLGAGQQAAEHHAVGTGHDRLGDVARILDAAVGDDRNARRTAGPGGLHHGGDLRHADARDDPGRADRAGAHAHLDPVGARLDQGLGPGVRRDVAAHDVRRGVLLEPGDHLEHRALVSVRRVHDDHVDAGLDQGPGPLVRVVADTDRGGDPEPALAVLGRVRILLALGEVLDRDQPAQPAEVVDQGQLLDLVPLQQGQRVVLADADRRGDQRHLRHDVAHLDVVVGDEAHVAVGDDADQHALGVDDRQAGDAVTPAEGVDLAQGVVGAAGDRVGDHPGLGALDEVDLRGLVLQRQIAVQHADAALAGHRDRHPGLGDRVHRAGEQRDGELDVAGQTGDGVDAARHHVGLARLEQHVIEGETQRHQTGRPRFSRRSIHRSSLAKRRSVSSYPSDCGPRLGGQRVRASTHRPYMGTVDTVQEEPIDPFNGDPADPAAGLDDLTEDAENDPLTEAERQDVLEDLSDLEIYQALLSPTGIRGLVIECEDCHEPHYFDWDLLRGNLRHLLTSGRPRVHEPAYDPDPDHYVTWEYARGYADGVHDTLTEGTDDES